MRRLDRSSLFCCADQGILCSVCRYSTPRLVFVCTPENRFHLMKFFQNISMEGINPFYGPLILFLTSSNRDVNAFRRFVHKLLQ